MEIHITFPGGKRVDAAFDHHVVRTDQPRALGGDESAPSPFDLFLSSLGTCAGLYVLGFCQTRQIPTDAIELVQTHRTEGDRLVGVDIDIRLPIDFPAKYRGAIQRAAEGCKVKKTLHSAPEVRVSVSVMQEHGLDISA